MPGKPFGPHEDYRLSRQDISLAEYWMLIVHRLAWMHQEGSPLRWFPSMPDDLSRREHPWPSDVCVAIPERLHTRRGLRTDIGIPPDCFVSVTATRRRLKGCLLAEYSVEALNLIMEATRNFAPARPQAQDDAAELQDRYESDQGEETFETSQHHDAKPPDVFLCSAMTMGVTESRLAEMQSDEAGESGRRRNKDEPNPIPAARRTRHLSLKQAAKLIGFNGSRKNAVAQLKRMIVAGKIAAHELNRQSYIFDIESFPEPARQRIKPSE